MLFSGLSSFSEMPPSFYLSEAKNLPNYKACPFHILYPQNGPRKWGVGGGQVEAGGSGLASF